MEIVYLADCPQYTGTVAAWLFAEWGRHISGATLERVETRLSGHLNRDRLPVTLVAHSEKNPIGTASLQASDMSARPDLSPWLASVFVVPDQRGKGVGTQLVLECLTVAKNLGISCLYLFTPDRERFYTRLGWSPLERLENRGQQVVIMSRLIH